MLKKELLDWVSGSSLNVFVTVSLKQGIENEVGLWSRLTREQTIKTAWLLRDRFTKAVVGKRKKLPFLVFAEGEGFLKRRHLHIVTALPSEMLFLDFSDKFRFQALKLDWVYNEIDVRLIGAGDQRRVIAYSLKEGTEAFLPEASYVPCKN